MPKFLSRKDFFQALMGQDPVAPSQVAPDQMYSRLSEAVMGLPFSERGALGKAYRQELSARQKRGEFSLAEGELAGLEAALKLAEDTGAPVTKEQFLSEYLNVPVVKEQVRSLDPKILEPQLPVDATREVEAALAELRGRFPRVEKVLEESVLTEEELMSSAKLELSPKYDGGGTTTKEQELMASKLNRVPGSYQESVIWVDDAKKHNPYTVGAPGRTTTHFATSTEASRRELGHIRSFVAKGPDKLVGFLDEIQSDSLQPAQDSYSLLKLDDQANDLAEEAVDSGDFEIFINKKREEILPKLEAGSRAHRRQSLLLDKAYSIADALSRQTANPFPRPKKDDPRMLSALGAQKVWEGLGVRRFLSDMVNKDVNAIGITNGVHQAKRNNHYPGEDKFEGSIAYYNNKLQQVVKDVLKKAGATKDELKPQFMPLEDMPSVPIDVDGNPLPPITLRDQREEFIDALVDNRSAEEFIDALVDQEFIDALVNKRSALAEAEQSRNFLDAVLPRGELLGFKNMGEFENSPDEVDLFMEYATDVANYVTDLADLPYDGNVPPTIAAEKLSVAADELLEIAAANRNDRGVKDSARNLAEHVIELARELKESDLANVNMGDLSLDIAQGVQINDGILALGARELPPVPEMVTESYTVRELVDDTQIVDDRPYAITPRIVESDAIFSGDDPEAATRVGLAREVIYDPTVVNFLDDVFALGAIRGQSYGDIDPNGVSLYEVYLDNADSDEGVANNASRDFQNVLQRTISRFQEEGWDGEEFNSLVAETLEAELFANQETVTADEYITTIEDIMARFGKKVVDLIPKGGGDAGLPRPARTSNISDEDFDIFRLSLGSSISPDRMQLIEQAYRNLPESTIVNNSVMRALADGRGPSEPIPNSILNGNRSSEEVNSLITGSLNDFKVLFDLIEKSGAARIGEQIPQTEFTTMVRNVERVTEEWNEGNSDVNVNDVLDALQEFKDDIAYDLLQDTTSRMNFFKFLASGQQTPQYRTVTKTREVPRMGPDKADPNKHRGFFMYQLSDKVKENVKKGLPFLSIPAAGVGLEETQAEKRANGGLVSLHKRLTRLTLGA